MSSPLPPTGDSPDPPPAWQPLSSIDRRIAGALVEKAKTTPEQYPMTLNSLRNACNQKSNRSPVMQLDEYQVEESLDRLRGLGAVVEVQESSRVPKFRHRMYEWLGVDKVEMAVMTELLLRGAQTLGELRGRAARMEPIADLGALRPILEGLEAKGLVIYLTPQGRGAVITHTLYTEKEMQRLRDEHGTAGSTQPTAAAAPRPAAPPPAATPTAPPTTIAPAAAPAPAPSASNETAALKAEIAELRQELAETKAELQELRSGLEAVRSDVDDLSRQLGV